MADKNDIKLFDDYRNSYANVVNKAISFSGMDVDKFVAAKARYLVEAADQHFGSRRDLKILDVGCGVGKYHGLLKSRYQDISGIDVSAECIAEASETHPDLNYRAYDGLKIPFNDASFDLAYAVCVVHHVPPANWDNFVREVKRVLRPGGLAMIFEHNPLNPLTRKAVRECPFDADAVLLSSRTAMNLLKNANFSDIRKRYILSIPPISGFAHGLDKLFSVVPSGAQYLVSGTA